MPIRQHTNRLIALKLNKIGTIRKMCINPLSPGNNAHLLDFWLTFVIVIIILYTCNMKWGNAQMVY